MVRGWSCEILARFTAGHVRICRACENNAVLFELEFLQNNEA